MMKWFKSKPGDKIADLAEQYRLEFIQHDDRRAELNRQLRELRVAPVSVEEVMKVFERLTGEIAEKEWGPVIRERLEYIWTNDDFHKDGWWHFDPVLNQRTGSIGMGALYLMLKPIFLDFVRSRLEQMIPRGTKLTFAEKARKIAELEAECNQACEQASQSQSAWRRLTGDPGADPRNPPPPVQKRDPADPGNVTPTPATHAKAKQSSALRNPSAEEAAAAARGVPLGGPIP